MCGFFSSGFTVRMIVRRPYFSPSKLSLCRPMLERHLGRPTGSEVLAAAVLLDDFGLTLGAYP